MSATDITKAVDLFTHAEGTVPNDHADRFMLILCLHVTVPALPEKIYRPGYHMHSRVIILKHSKPSWKTILFRVLWEGLRKTL